MAAVKKGAAAVLLLNRSSRRSFVADEDIMRAAEGTKTKVHSIVCDLSSFSVTREAAFDARDLAEQSYGGLDVLLCNAGTGAGLDDRTGDGCDVQMQVNHLSHYVLVAYLMPTLEMAAANRGEARVVTVSSPARNLPLGRHSTAEHLRKCEPHTLGGDGGTFIGMCARPSDSPPPPLLHPGLELGACLPDPTARELLNVPHAAPIPRPCSARGRDLFDPTPPCRAPQNQRYAQSKLATSLFAMALHDKLAAQDDEKWRLLKAVCADPGFIKQVPVLPPVRPRWL